MKHLYFGLAALAATCSAQPQIIQQQKDEVYIQHGGVVVAPGSLPVMAGMIGSDGRMGLLNVTGKPFSGTEVRKSLQTLANGAKIGGSDSNQLYRDDQGRTRTEQTIGGRTTIVIMDPVARFVAILDRNAKTARKTPIPAGAVNGAVSVADGKVMVRMGSTKEVVETRSTSGAAAAMPRMGIRPQADAPANLVRQELGEKLINGVLATGTRETRTIPVGAIGNDRDLQMIDERWFSNDLQLVVKSVNSDPRFGETNYELTKIERAQQDPALFQIPADYTITSDKLRLPDMKTGKE